MLPGWSRRRRAEQLLGRQRERDVLDRLLRGRAGRPRRRRSRCTASRASARPRLLEYAVEAAPDFRVARAVGVEGEMELAFAALQQLCSPSLDLMERLPDPQRDALEVALGLSAGRPPNPFLVGLAVLNLLSEAAEEQPLLCVVDDAQWLDRASARALAFVARRLLAERIAMRLRGAGADRGARRLRGASRRAARPSGCASAARLGPGGAARRARARADRRRDTRESTRPPGAAARADARAARGWVRPAGGAASLGPDRGELRPAARAAAARHAAAAARGRGRSDRRRRARVAGRATASESRSRPRTARVGRPCRASTPVSCSVIHSCARPCTGRRDQTSGSEVHRALAEATDPDIDPDRRAWHRAQAASRPDEDVAAELERSAARAQARGGFAAAAAFLERAAALTPDAVATCARALAAAQAKVQAGALDDALALLATAEVGALDELEQAQVDVAARARSPSLATRGSDAAALLLAAAERLARARPCARPRDLPGGTDSCHLRRAAGRAGRELERGGRSRASGTAERRRRAAGPAARRSGGAVSATDGPPCRVLRQAQRAFGTMRCRRREQLRWMWLARSRRFTCGTTRMGAAIGRQFSWPARPEHSAILPSLSATAARCMLFAGELATAASLSRRPCHGGDRADRNRRPYRAVGMVGDARPRGRSDTP